MKYSQLIISKRILEKLKYKHKVTTEEIWECFLNRVGGFLEDSRVSHVTDPSTMWFIAETDNGRKLKVIFMELNDGNYEIKSAFEPNVTEVRIYEKYS